MVPLLSTSYLPPISYIAAFIQSKHIVIEKHEHFIKQTIRNRAYIYGANGILPLIIPIQHSGLFSIPIYEVKISNAVDWKKIHWKSIVSAYRNSAFFEYYEDDFAAHFNRETETLFEFNMGLINLLLHLLRVEVGVHFTTDYQKEVSDLIDLRASFHSYDPVSIRTTTSKNSYRQVFSANHGFIGNLSILDLLFNEGPESIRYLIPEHP